MNITNEAVPRTFVAFWKSLDGLFPKASLKNIFKNIVT